VRPGAAAWWQPIETVSSSEGGFERNYQGSALLFRWPLELSPGDAMDVSVRIEVRCTRDRRADELAPRAVGIEGAGTLDLDRVAETPAGVTATPGAR
jgi:hypothetical protein